MRLTLVSLLLLLRVDDANNLAEASLLLLARGGATATSCEKTIGDESAARLGEVFHSAVRCGPNLDAGDGLLQGLSVHKKEAGKWQSFPSSSIQWSLPTFPDVLVHTDSPLYIYVIVEEEFFLVILDIMHHMFIMLLMFTTIILILHIMFIQIARSKSMLRKSLFL